MSTTTNLIPVRIDASSSDGSVRIIDTILIDTKCLPISHAHAPNGNAHVSLSMTRTSLCSLVDSNASHLTNSVLQDAEVHGAFHSYNSTGSRLDLLSDEKLYQDIETQIRTQLSIALSSGKEDLMSFSSESFSGHVPVIPGGTISSHEKVHETALPSEENEIRSGITRVKLRLRQENIVLVDEFDYDIKSSGIEGCDPFSIANSLVEDLKLPPEFIIHVSVSIVEQMYGIRVSDAIEKFTSNSTREVPSALVLDVKKEGTSSDFMQIMFNR